MLSPPSGNPLSHTARRNRSTGAGPLHVSVIVPLFNEVENIPHLCRRVVMALQEWNHSYELLLVDDGSTDGSETVLRDMCAADARIKVVALRRNYGQTAALQCGMDHASGEVIVMLDGDLQNDPDDIPRLVEALEQGYDLVHGWRKERHDALFSRKIPSRIANALISWSTGFPIHDLGCTLKAMRREIAEDIELCGEMHRFIPILAHWKGARCHEVVTRHAPRTRGKTKYGLSRTFRVILDLLTVQYLLRFSTRPMHLFGGTALVMGSIGILSCVATVAMKLFQGVDMSGNPLLLMSAMFLIFAVQFLGQGLKSEITSRTFYSATGQRPYTVRHRLNLQAESAATTTLPLRKAG